MQKLIAALRRIVTTITLVAVMLGALAPTPATANNGVLAGFEAEIHCNKEDDTTILHLYWAMDGLRTCEAAVDSADLSCLGLQAKDYFNRTGKRSVWAVVPFYHFHKGWYEMEVEIRLQKNGQMAAWAHPGQKTKVEKPKVRLKAKEVKGKVCR